MREVITKQENSREGETERKVDNVSENVDMLVESMGSASASG